METGKSLVTLAQKSNQFQVCTLERVALYLLFAYLVWAEMVGWHHRLDGHEFEQAPGVGDGQGSLACCSPWGHKELDTTE